ncbi:MAG: AbrB/MazE/SpoVT family DNA-binding domain-containing protein [Candidatus Wildermuthbacteria bacterium]|nr:AbrB/MazE/SpoVT family DNA-binding domain-containing protein [Candidatus Wildermuthbacteria bacterium]
MIEPTVKIGPKHQITIPAEVFKKLQLKEGDFLGASVKDAEIVLRPKRLVPRNQEWFWTEEWQSKEKEADKDIRKGRLYGPFTNAKGLIRSLRSKK